MKNLSPYIEKILRDMHFTPRPDCDNVWWRYGGLEQIFLSEALLELIDKIYSHGHVDGWERGAYEEQQQEDVGPEIEEILHKLDK
jgi:hypothetical protein